MARAEVSRGGDRQFNEHVTITGTLASGSAEIAAHSVCLRPNHNNAAGAQFCYNATVPSSTSSAPTAAPTAAPVSTDCSSDDASYTFKKTLASGLLLYWKITGAAVTFEMRHTSSTAGYVSLGVNDRSDMVGGDAMVATSASVSKYDLNGMSASAVVQQTSSRQDLTGTSYTHAGGVVKAIFTRPLAAARRHGSAAATGGKSILASGMNTFIWAHGGSTLGYHTARGILRLDLATCGSSVVESDKSKFTAHAWLMALVWGVIIPLGALFASATRPAGGAVVQVSSWPQIHIGIQLMGCVLGTAGFVMAYLGTEERKGEHFNGTHQKVGLALLILGWTQIVIGIFRPANDPVEETLLHKLWAIKHRVVGIGLVVGAACNIYKGMDIFDSSNTSRGLYTAWLVLVALAFVALYAYKAARGNAADSVTVAARGPDSQGSQYNTMEAKMDGVASGRVSAPAAMEL